jgi:hypothetical protein
MALVLLGELPTVSAPVEIFPHNSFNGKPKASVNRAEQRRLRLTVKQ